MLKMALLDCAINEKCCSVDGGRGICPLFSYSPWGIWQFKSPHPREFAIQGQKKIANSRAISGDAGAAGIDWCINVKVELGSTFTFTRDLSYIAFIYLSA